MAMDDPVENPLQELITRSMRRNAIMARMVPPHYRIRLEASSEQLDALSDAWRTILERAELVPVDVIEATWRLLDHAEDVVDQLLLEWQHEIEAKNTTR